MNVAKAIKITLIGLSVANLSLIFLFPIYTPYVIAGSVAMSSIASVITWDDLVAITGADLANIKVSDHLSQAVPVTHKLYTRSEIPEGSRIIE